MQNMINISLPVVLMSLFVLVIVSTIILLELSIIFSFSILLPVSSSLTEMSRASLSGISSDTSGKPFPVSQRDTALSVTLIFSASSFCVKLFSFLSCAINAPVLFSIIHPTFQLNIITKRCICHPMNHRIGLNCKESAPLFN